MCKLLRTNYIKEDYDKNYTNRGLMCLNVWTCNTQEFSEYINDAFLYDGVTCMSGYESIFVQMSHHLSVKAEYMFQKSGKLDRRTDIAETADDAMLVLKAGVFARHKINKRLTSPFQYVEGHPNLNVHYHFWRDNHHIEWLRKKTKETGNFKTFNIKKESPPHYTFDKKLPIFLHKILDK